ncbi:probable metabolite transport protein CsbC, partial [Pollicipes pollicipes]|uniref:probable metabolite transport protein CsbC n=1 Tax=Pollicipes pollicipes TaxID=41117 RepID=UPI0018851EF9
MVVVGQQLLALGLNGGMNSVTLIQVPDDPDGFLSADQLNWSIAATALGAVLGSLLGTPVLFIVVGVVPAALCLFGLLFLPNSAKWLLSRGHSEEEALRSIRFFRGAQVDAAAEMVLYVWCGGATLMLITAFVLAPVRLPLSEYQRSTLPAALSALVCVPGGIIIERYGRLPVLCLGGALSTVGCAMIAAYFFLAAESQERLGWIVLAGAALALVAHVGLLSNVAFGYATELLPNKTRTLASNIVITVLFVNEFLLTKTYPLIKEGVGLGWGFIIHML